jgi:hypothetical protein
MKREQKRTCEHLSSQVVACPVSKMGAVRGDIKRQQQKKLGIGVLLTSRIGRLVGVTVIPSRRLALAIR